MRCPVCGSTINDACRFCTVCGSPVEENAPAMRDAADATDADESTSFTATPLIGSDNGSATPGDAKRQTNFSAAMDETGKSSKRRMPLVFLLALAIALAAGTAFAAYQVYVNVIAPMQQQAEQPQAGEDGAAAPAPAPEEPLTIGVKNRQLVVSTMSDPYYGDGAKADRTWTYPELVGSRQDDAVDAINAFISQKFESDAARTESLDAVSYMDDPEAGTPGVIVARYASVTFLSDRYVCVFDAMYTTWWGAHGNAFNDAYIFDLETGEQVTAAQAAGVSEEELAARADAAVRVFYNREGSDLYTIDEVADQATKGTYYLADEGVVLATDDYALGSYAYGRRNIVVIPFDDSIEAGQTLEVISTR